MRHDVRTMPYRAMVLTLAKAPKDVLSDLTPETANLVHAALGISDEAGELVGKLKKLSMYGKEVEPHTVLEEIGDLKFYIEMVMAHYGWTWEDADAANQSKLAERYPEGVFTRDAAIKRADKPGEGWYHYEFASSDRQGFLNRRYHAESRAEADMQAEAYSAKLAADFDGTTWRYRLDRFKADES